jgi:hypothetical protein
LKQRQKQAGLAGLGELYGENEKEELGALGAENEATDAATKAGQSGWFQNLIAGINAASNAAKAAKPGGF